MRRTSLQENGPTRMLCEESNHERGRRKTSLQTFHALRSKSPQREDEIHIQVNRSRKTSSQFDKATASLSIGVNMVQRKASLQVEHEKILHQRSPTFPRKVFIDDDIPAIRRERKMSLQIGHEHSYITPTLPMEPKPERKRSLTKEKVVLNNETGTNSVARTSPARKLSLHSDHQEKKGDPMKGSVDNKTSKRLGLREGEAVVDDSGRMSVKPGLVRKQDQPSCTPVLSSISRKKSIQEGKNRLFKNKTKEEEKARRPSSQGTKSRLLSGLRTSASPTNNNTIQHMRKVSLPDRYSPRTTSSPQDDIPKWQRDILQIELTDDNTVQSTQIVQFENNKPKLPPIKQVSSAAAICEPATQTTCSTIGEKEEANTQFDTSTLIKECINEFVQQQHEKESVVLTNTEVGHEKPSSSKNDMSELVCPFDEEDNHVWENDSDLLESFE